MGHTVGHRRPRLRGVRAAPTLTVTATTGVTMSDRHEPEHPAKPDSPTDIKKPSWTYVLRKTVHEFSRDECTMLAAALTYYAVLSLFPALIALASILALV